MIIYLYKKTHLITGLNYLGKTKVSKPHEYRGSGVDWIKHLRDFGDITKTEILMECHSKEELSFWGRYYSILWNIVSAQDDFGNKIWANRIPETGGGGPDRIISSVQIQQTIETKRYRNTSSYLPHIIQKANATKKIRGTGFDSDSVKAKSKISRTENGNFHSAPHVVAKQQITQQLNKTGNFCRITCEHCHRNMGKPQYSRWHGDNCKSLQTPNNPTLT